MLSLDNIINLACEFMPKNELSFDTSKLFLRGKALKFYLKNLLRKVLKRSWVA